jgi:hypothetical protein
MMNEKLETLSGMKLTVDVSATFDNCFFHNYALYLLSNKLPLPKDLFHFKSLLTHNSQAEKLHHFFSDPSKLNLFSSLAPHVEDEPPTYIFEKTLVLGVLLREWFATQLVANSEHKIKMLKGDGGVLSAFKNYKEYREYISKEDLYSAEFGLLYESNVAFLEHFFNRTQDEDKNSPFEKYFSDSQSDEEAIENYWINEGYELYCQRMAQLYVKLSYIEIIPMMKIIDQSLTMYSTNDSSIVAEYIGTDEKLPEFKIAIDVQQGHYFLFKTEATQDDLEEYQRSYTQYKADRNVLLHGDTLPVTSILVRVICPKGLLDEEPFDVLLKLLSEQMEKQSDVVLPKQSDVVLSNQMAPNYSFLIRVGLSMVGTTATVATLFGIAIQTNQYDPGASLVEEALLTVGFSTLTSLGYGLYNFFQSQPKIKAPEESEIELDSWGLPHQKLS